MVRELGGQSVLVAYGVCRAGESLTTTKRRELGGSLPEYMVPLVFVEVAELPLTANGKLDRRGLPDPELEEVSWEAPESLAEEMLCGLFGELTGRAEVSVTSNFFALGGDSIQVIRLVGRGRALGFGFGVRDVFRHPTPRALAALVADVADATDETVMQVVPGSGRIGDGRVVLSHGQQRLWLLSQLEGQEGL